MRNPRFDFLFQVNKVVPFCFFVSFEDLQKQFCGISSHFDTVVAISRGIKRQKTKTNQLN